MLPPRHHATWIVYDATHVVTYAQICMADNSRTGGVKDGFAEAHPFPVGGVVLHDAGVGEASAEHAVERVPQHGVHDVPDGSNEGGARHRYPSGRVIKSAACVYMKASLQAYRGGWLTSTLPFLLKR